MAYPYRFPFVSAWAALVNDLPTIFETEALAKTTSGEPQPWLVEIVRVMVRDPFSGGCFGHVPLDELWTYRVDEPICKNTFLKLVGYDKYGHPYCVHQHKLPDRAA